MGEISKVKSEVGQVITRFTPPFIDINGIADRFERIKTYPNGKDDIQDWQRVRDTNGGKEIIKCANKKVVILKPSKHPQVYDETCK